MGWLTMSLISYVTRIHFAEHVLEDAFEAELESLAMRRPLIISDDGPQRRIVVDRLLAAVPRSMSPLLFEMNSHTATQASADEAARIFIEQEADGLVGFGGAAALNLAKAVGLRVSHDGPLHQYSGEGGRARIRDTIPRVIAIPTTSGSCAEAIGTSVLSMSDGTSATFVSACLTPRVVICDPTLTLDMPARQSAGAGMDALTHCLETYIATAYNPPADGIARDGLRRAVQSIERVVSDGHDIEARREMMAAALNGALANQKGLGAVHAMSHALAAAIGHELDHGALNAVLLPHALAFNAPAVAQRYRDIRREFGLRSNADLGEAVIRLRERIGLPSTLGEMGIDGQAIARAAPFAELDYSNRTNPRRATANDYWAMMQAAM
ncbi:iron-containing alcohol dehydrogenase [Mesorhizobium sp. CAU 1732]|uniref:iron-containing alcohol dehydrogenase n=1 Tax=Mesorhizobium sp. CAU 1732 TaxID=3140358 RepID=UPI00326005AC